jgi:hypothetical protein
MEKGSHHKPTDKRNLVIDEETLLSITHIKTCRHLEGVTFDPQGQRAEVTNRFSDTVSVLDLDEPSRWNGLRLRKVTPSRSRPCYSPMPRELAHDQSTTTPIRPRFCYDGAPQSPTQCPVADLIRDSSGISEVISRSEMSRNPSGRRLASSPRSFAD